MEEESNKNVYIVMICLLAIGLFIGIVMIIAGFVALLDANFEGLGLVLFGIFISILMGSLLFQYVIKLINFQPKLDGIDGILQELSELDFPNGAKFHWEVEDDDGLMFVQTKRGKVKGEVISFAKEWFDDYQNLGIDEIAEKLFEEFEIRKKMAEIQERSKNSRIRKKAEERLYGKAKSKRVTLDDELKEAVYEKFDYSCATCGATENLHIHHKDHNPANNTMANLVLICGVCHKKVHMKVR